MELYFVLIVLVIVVGSCVYYRASIKEVVVPELTDELDWRDSVTSAVRPLASEDEEDCEPGREVIYWISQLENLIGKLEQGLTPAEVSGINELLEKYTYWDYERSGILDYDRANWGFTENRKDIVYRKGHEEALIAELREELLYLRG
jgi:hypothetical protein